MNSMGAAERLARGREDFPHQAGPADVVQSNPWVRMGALLGDILEVEGKILVRQLLIVVGLSMLATTLLVLVAALLVGAVIIGIIAVQPGIPPVAIFLCLLLVSVIALFCIGMALRRQVEACNITFPRMREAIKESMICMEPIFRHWNGM